MKRSTLFLVILAAALGLLVYLIERKDEKSHQTDNVNSAFTLKREDIAELTLTRAGSGTIKIRNDEGQWLITEPVNTPADQTAVGAIAEGIADAQVERRITASSEEEQTYGLAQAPVSIGFRLKNGEDHRLRLGSVDFSGSFIYSRIDESGDIALLPAWLAVSADKPLNDLRDRSLLNAPKDEVSSILLENGHGRIMVVRDGSDWALKTPWETPADSVAVDAILDGVSSGEAQEFLSETAENAAQYGLDRPQLTLTLNLERGEEKRLMIGARQENLFFAKRADHTPIFKVESSLYDKLNVKPESLYDRNIIRFNVDDLTRAKIKNQHQTLVAEKDQEGRWKVLEPAGEKGKEADLLSILNVLKTTRADEVLGQAPRALATKLASPAAEIEITDKTGKAQLLKLSEAQGSTVYAMRSDSLLVYKIEKYVLDGLNLKFSDVVKDESQ